MPTQACPLRVNVCAPCNDAPIENLSAEAPDAAVYLGNFYGFESPILGDLYSVLGCLNWCWSEVSQEEADDCARQQEELCVGTNAAPYDGGRWSPIVGGGGGDGGYQQRGMFASWQHTCSVACPGGGTFTYILPSQAVRSSVSREQVEALAHALCYKRMLKYLFCCTTDLGGCCKDIVTSKLLSVEGGTSPYHFSVTAGLLPDGLVLSDDGILSGTPTTAGTSTFTVHITDSSGQSCYWERAFAFVVVDITSPDPLPQAIIGDVYSYVFTQVGVGASGKWSVQSGTLPVGLTLDETTGQLWGTPTTTGTSVFTVLLQDEVLDVACSKQFSLTCVPTCEDCEVGGYAYTPVPYIVGYDPLAFDPAGWFCTLPGSLPEWDGYFRHQLGVCHWAPVIIHPHPGNPYATTIRGLAVITAKLVYNSGVVPHEVVLEIACQASGPYWTLFYGVRQAVGGHLSICGTYLNTDPDGISAGPGSINIQFGEPPP